MQQFAESFYKSNTWKQCRASYLKSVGGLCERCYAKGLIVPAKIVHHKTYITKHNIKDPSITLDWSNLEALCQNCHNEEHIATHRRYRVDEFGSVIFD